MVHAVISSVLVTAATLIAPAMAAAQTGNGTISGTVSRASDNTGLANVQVNAYTATGAFVSSVTTASTGTYQLTLAPGTYYIQTSNSLGFINQLYRSSGNLSCGTGCPFYTNGTGLTVSSGSSTANIDFSLTLGGRISGTVTAADGTTPLGSIQLYFFTSSNVRVAFAFTNSAGQYTTNEGLAAGTYFLKTYNSQGYLDELYNNVLCPSTNCPLTGGTGIAVTLGNTTSGINFSLDRGGRISGRVTSGTTPLANVGVYAYNSSGQFVDYGFTAQDGTYITFGGLAAGNYFLRTFAGQGYLDELHNNISCATGCQITGGTPVAATVGNTTTGIDFDLALGGRISGRVTGAGSPLANVSITVFNSTNQSVAFASTDADGNYTLGQGLPTGTYYARTSVPFDSPFLNELFGGTICFTTCQPNTSTPIAITTGQITPNINFELDRGGTITGTVRSSSGGINGASVLVYDSTGAFITSATTNIDGAYTVSRLTAGNYFLRTSAGQGFLDKLYRDLTCSFGCTVTSGTAVAVTLGNTTSSIDFTLTLGGRISGRVTGGGTPLQSASITLFNANNISVASGFTDANGDFTTVNGVASGTYYARASAPFGSAYLNELYNDIACPITCSPNQGTAITVTTGSVTPNINFELPEGGRIAGTVRSGSTVLANVGISLTGVSGTFRNTTTDSNGQYSLIGLPTDVYYLRSSNTAGYVDELHNGILCLGFCANSGPGVAVTAPQLTSGVDFDLAPGARFSGRVTDSDGAPLSSVSIDVRTASGGFLFGSSTVTDTTGNYLTRSGLPPGTYYLSTFNNLGAVDELYNNIPCPRGNCSPSIGTGTAFEITGPGTTSDINFVLDRGGSVSGTVRDSGGQPIQSASITIFDTAGFSASFASTNGQGVYTASGLPTGTYFVRVTTSQAIAELYDDIPCFSCTSTTGAGVNVTGGSTTTGIDFVLEQGGRVSGTITDANTGQTLASVSVSIVNQVGTGVSSSSSNQGTYSTATGLPTGTYYARTSNSLGYVDEIYNDVPCAGSACSSLTTSRGTPFTVTAGSAVSNINFALVPGGSITGTVTGVDTNAPLANVGVQIFDSGGRSVRSSTTNSAGQYSVTGLPAGNYFALTFNSLGYINERHDNTPCVGCRATDGTPIAVTLGAATTVNFALAPGGRISGVVNTAAGVPLSGVTVLVFASTGTSSVASAATNGAGQFITATGLPTGTYYVRTSNSLNYIDQLFVSPTNRDCLLCTPNTGTGIAVTAGQTVQNINFSLRRAGRVRGRITTGGTALAGVAVLIVDRSGRQVASGTSNYLGDYVTTGGLPTGQYFAQTSNQLNYINERYNNEHCLRCAAELGAAISVTEGATTPNIDFDLDLGGRISGRILGPQGVGLPSVSVSIFNANNELVTSGFTNAQGIYVTTGGLPAGNYFARTFNSLGFADQIYDNSTCTVCSPNTGTRIQVSAGATTANINFLLAVGGRISGRVTDAAGAGVADVRVQIHDTNGQFVISASTDGSGNYLTTALPGGTYHARTSNSVGLIDEIYNDIACVGGCQPQTGARISVTTGQTTPNIDFSLVAGAGISGRVTSGSTGLSNISVFIVNAGGTGVTSAVTNEAGDYAVRGLTPGTYYARTFNNLGFLDEIYDNIVCAGTCIATRGTAIVVTAGTITSGRNFDLVSGGRISGQVTDAAGAPLENVTVNIFNAAGIRFTSGVTNSAGQYATFGGLPAGTYYAATNNNLGLINEVYNDISCGGVCVPSVGQAITVTAGNTTSGINFALASGGRVSGIVRAAGTNLPIANLSVGIFAVGGTFVTSALTNAAGEYITARGLGAGRYFASTSSAQGFLNERSAEFGVTPPTTTTDINFTLTLGGRVTGRVTNAGSGEGLPAVQVQFFDRSNVRIGAAVTGADGRYSTPGLSVGSYFARTSNTGGFIDERYNNQVCLGCVANLGTPIVVTAGSITADIDFALDAGGSFRGRITDVAGGAALGGIIVTAFNSTGSPLRTATTDDTGLYEIVGLPTGPYFAQTRNERGYADEVYNDVACSYREPCSVTTGTAITVTQGSAQSGIDFGLGTAGRISGRVTDTATPPVAIAEALVTIYDVNGRQVAQVTTDGAGAYSTAGGLPPGRYFAQAFADSYVREIYSELPCFPRCVVTDGQAITIASGGAASGINFTLQRGGRISGSVSEGGTPLPNVTVNVFSIGRDVFISQATTDGSGRYITREGLLPGRYMVRTVNDIGRVNKIFGGSVPCLGDIRECEGGNPVTVTAGEITGGIDFDLPRGALVEGFVLDESPTPLPGEAVAPAAVALAEVDVVVFDDKGKKVAEGKTDTTGKYESKSGMPTGRYFISTKNKLDFTDKAKGGVDCALAKCDVTRSEPVEIVNTSLSRVDFGLRKGGRITGRVTGRRDSAVVPLPDLKVEIYGSTGQLLTSVTTDAGGNYSVDSGLPTGDYFVKTANELGYVDRIYNNRPCDACKITDGTKIAVSVGATVTGIDFELVRGALVSGTIFNRNSGVPITEAPVVIKKIVGNTVETVAKAKTDDKGVFTTSLPQGTYYAQTDGLPGYQTKIYRQPTGSGPLRGQIWPTCPLGLCDPSLGTPIDLASGAFVGQIDIGLDSCPALTVSPARLPIGSLGTPYSQTISVSGGAAPYNFRVTEGELPPGFNLNASTGSLSGSTSAAGSTSFTVAVLDANGCAGTRAYNPTICSIDISATSASVSTAAGSGTLNIMAAAGDCPWTATSDSSWLTLSSSSGTGNATITYSYSARGAFAQPRVGTITIGAHSFRLTQAGIVPTFTVSPTTINVHPRGGANSAEVTANTTDATWTVTSNESWITPVTTAGTGSGPATFNVARNSMPAARTGTVSVAGQNVTVVQLPNGVPGEPVNLSARVTGGRARFTWAPPLTGGDATGYVLAAGLAPGQTLITFASPGATTVYDLGLTLPPGQYYFRVSGQNEFGAGAPSEDYELVVGPGGENRPDAPLNLAATITAGGLLNVTWIAPPTGGTPTGYVLEVGSGPGLANLATVPVSTPSFSYSGVPPGNYFLRVRAVNGGGQSAPSNEILLNAGGVPPPPGAPRAATATATAGGNVTIAWLAPVDGGAPTSYVLEAGSARGLANLATVNVGAGTSISFSGVPSGVYWLRIRGQNAQGAGMASNDVRLVVP